MESQMGLEVFDNCFYKIKHRKSNRKKTFLKNSGKHNTYYELMQL